MKIFKVCILSMIIYFVFPAIMFAGDSVFNPKKDINSGPTYATQQWVQQYIQQYVQQTLDGLDTGPTGPPCDWNGWKTVSNPCKSKCTGYRIIRRCTSYGSKFLKYCDQGHVTDTKAERCCTNWYCKYWSK